jgi:hypothetical protein
VSTPPPKTMGIRYRAIRHPRSQRRIPRLFLLMMITVGSTSLNVKGSRGQIQSPRPKTKNCHEICNSVPLTFSPAPRIKHVSARTTGKK